MAGEKILENTEARKIPRHMEMWCQGEMGQSTMTLSAMYVRHWYTTLINVDGNQ